MVPPLKGLSVVDLSQALAGPYCSLMLADMGAEVIKIEMPGKGDDIRRWGPPFLDGESTYFLCINRGKKSVTVNLKTPEGQEIVRKLASKADIFLENFRPGVVDKLRVGYSEIRKLNPRIIYCSISGFGQDGPYRDRPAYDLIVQGMGGLMSVTGEPDGPPVKVGVSITDIGAGMFGCYGILNALYHREKTGKGHFVDVSMLDCQVAWMSFLATGYLASGMVPNRLGSAHPSIVPYQAFRTKDIYITIGVGNESQWRSFCTAIGAEHLVEDPRFGINAKRVANRVELIREIQNILETRDGEHWLSVLSKAEVPCGPIYTMDKVLSDPQVLHRQMVVAVKQQRIGKVRMPGIPVKLSETPGEISIPAPQLGEHNEEILGQLGYSASQIRGFKEKGII